MVPPGRALGKGCNNVLRGQFELFFREKRNSVPAIFNLFHLMAHINSLLKFCDTHTIYFFADLTKNWYNFDWFTNNNNSNHLHFLLQSDFWKSQVPIIVYKDFWPWLVWLSELSAGLRTKGSPVQLPVRAHAWVAGQVPSRGAQEATTHWCFTPLLSPSLPLSLEMNKWSL